MIGVDTNVLVRYLAQDDDVQSPVASRVIDGFTPETPGFVSQVVLVETVWVLTRAYGMPREAIANVIETLLRSRDILVEGREAGYPALAIYRATRAYFSDALIEHVGRLAGCSETLTLDKGAASDTGMRLLGV